MSSENCTTMDLKQCDIQEKETAQEKVAAKKSRTNPFVIFLFICLGIFSLITLLLISWPLMAWIGSLK